MSISLNDIHTETDFYDLFNCGYINGKKILASERLYVLEDIDYYKNKSSFSEYDASYNKISGSEGDNGSDSGTESSIEDGNDHKNKWHSIAKRVNCQKKSRSKTKSVNLMSFSQFIGLIDGIMEREGIMVVINTKSPEWLEAIFSEPGVISVKI